MKATFSGTQKIGLGAHRMRLEDPAHREALELALRSGIETIEVSSLFNNGAAERLVGEVARGFRAQIKLVSKIGYIMGDTLTQAFERSRNGNPLLDTVKIKEGCWHSLAPDFLDEELTRALSRLRTTHVDVLLLHDPEHLLKALGGAHGENVDRFYEKLSNTFAYLEAQVQAGRVGAYGIASSAFSIREDQSDFLSLERVLEIAERSGSGHHFKVIEFPLNIFEAEAYFERNNSNRTVFELAKEANLEVLFNRPLHAISNGQAVRLTDYEKSSANPLEQIAKAVTRLESIERERPLDKEIPIAVMAWAKSLGPENLEQIGGIAAWREIVKWRIEPSLGEFREEVSRHTDPATQSWLHHYEMAAEEVISAVDAALENQASQRSAQVSQRLTEIAPELTAEASLSQKVLKLYSSLGVGTPIIGLRRPEYVRDVLAASDLAQVTQEKFTQVAAEYRFLGRLRL